MDAFLILILVVVIGVIGLNIWLKIPSKKWTELKKNDPEEYERRLSEMKEKFQQNIPIQKEKQSTSNNTEIHCPKCGSTQIHSDRRGWNIATGLLGSSSIMCTCLKCGESWKAGSI